MELSIPARLAFVGLWNFCDDAGVHPASPKTLKAEVFPSDAFTVEEVSAWVAEMVAHGLVAEFEADGKRYWHVTGWSRHQKIDRPNPRHPSPPAVESGTIPRTLDEHSTNTPRTLDEHSAPESKGVESTGKETTTSSSPAGDPLACPVEEIVKLYHDAMPNNPRCKVLNAARRGTIKARWREAAGLSCPPWRARLFRRDRQQHAVSRQHPPLCGNRPRQGKPKAHDCGGEHTGRIL